jgi:hypothetical protein
MKFKYSYFFLICFGPLVLFGQTEEEEEFIPKTFTSTRIVCGHSVETLPERTMDFRIEHRFGDMFGVNGGVQNMFGFDNLADIRIALEYGVTNDLMLGFGRSKGTNTPFRSLLDGFVKYRALRQNKDCPISLTGTTGVTFSYMTASNDISQVNHFPKIKHRFAYFSQMNIARRFGERFSAALMPTYIHQNYVAADDQNNVFALGAALRAKFTQRFALVAEYYHAFASKGNRPSEIYKQSLAFALEWATFGHTFTINVTNAPGIGETQFVNNTYSDWLKGQFRLGFCVARKFEFDNH